MKLYSVTLEAALEKAYIVAANFPEASKAADLNWHMAVRAIVEVPSGSVKVVDCGR